MQKPSQSPQYRIYTKPSAGVRQIKDLFKDQQEPTYFLILLLQFNINDGIHQFLMEEQLQRKRHLETISFVEKNSNALMEYQTYMREVFFILEKADLQNRSLQVFNLFISNQVVNYSFPRDTIPAAKDWLTALSFFIAWLVSNKTWIKVISFINLAVMGLIVIFWTIYYALDAKKPKTTSLCKGLNDMKKLIEQNWLLGQKEQGPQLSDKEELVIRQFRKQRYQMNLQYNFIKILFLKIQEDIDEKRRERKDMDFLNEIKNKAGQRYKKSSNNTKGRIKIHLNKLITEAKQSLNITNIQILRKIHSSFEQFEYQTSYSSRYVQWIKRNSTSNKTFRDFSSYIGSTLLAIGKSITYVVTYDTAEGIICGIYTSYYIFLLIFAAFWFLVLKNWNEKEKTRLNTELIKFKEQKEAQSMQNNFSSSRMNTDFKEEEKDHSKFAQIGTLEKNDS